MARGGGGRSKGRSGGRSGGRPVARSGRRSGARSTRARGKGRAKGRSRSRSRARGRAPSRSASRGRRSASRSRSASSRRSASPGGSAFRPQNFATKIKQIGKKAAPKYVVQARTIKLLSSFLNEIVKNVTQKAKENVEEMGKKTITYTDVMVAAMNLFGDQNKWIEKIMKRGQAKSKAYEDKIGFSIPRDRKDPADDLPDDVEMVEAPRLLSEQ